MEMYAHIIALLPEEAQPEATTFTHSYTKTYEGAKFCVRLREKAFFCILGLNGTPLTTQQKSFGFGAGPLAETIQKAWSGAVEAMGLI